MADFTKDEMDMLATRLLACPECKGRGRLDYAILHAMELDVENATRPVDETTVKAPSVEVKTCQTCRGTGYLK